LRHRLGANLLALGLTSFTVSGTLAVIGFLEFSMWLNHVQVLNGDFPDRDLVLKNALSFGIGRPGSIEKVGKHRQTRCPNSFGKPGLRISENYRKKRSS
jgi:hypothetical protein